MRYNSEPVNPNEPTNDVTLDCGDIKCPHVALCALGVWAVTREVQRAMAEGVVYTNRFVVTHIPTGYKLANSMTERDALRTLRKLYDAFPAFAAEGSTSLSQYNAKDKLVLASCFPKHAVSDCEWYLRALNQGV